MFICVIEVGKSSVVFVQWRQRNVPKSLIAHCNCFVDWSSLKYRGRRGGGSTPYRLYGETPPKRGAFFRPQVYEKVGKSFNLVVKGTKRANRCILWLWISPNNVLILWFIQSSELDIRNGWHLFNRRYTKEVLFLLKKQRKGQGLDLGVEPPCIKMFGVSLRVNLSLC